MPGPGIKKIISPREPPDNVFDRDVFIVYIVS